MKHLRIFLFVIALGFVAVKIQAQTPASTIKWMTLTEAEQLQKERPKKILIDIYTDWCGWCKKLDATTWVDPKVVDYVNQNFYAVKLNAESKDPITFKGKVHTLEGRTNTIAAEVMGSSTGYPTTTFFDEKTEMITAIPGYMQTDMMLKVLTYINENHYKTVDWNTYYNDLPAGGN